jgi:hypothetical protein
MRRSFFAAGADAGAAAGVVVGNRPRRRRADDDDAPRHRLIANAAAMGFRRLNSLSARTDHLCRGAQWPDRADLWRPHRPAGAVVRDRRCANAFSFVAFRHRGYRHENAAIPGCLAPVLAAAAWWNGAANRTRQIRESGHSRRKGTGTWGSGSPGPRRIQERARKPSNQDNGVRAWRVRGVKRQGNLVSVETNPDDTPSGAGT